MAPDSAVRQSAVGQGDVMASVDDGRFLIADISRDEAWLSIPVDAAATLSAHR